MNFCGVYATSMSDIKKSFMPFGTHLNREGRSVRAISRGEKNNLVLTTSGVGSLGNLGCLHLVKKSLLECWDYNKI